VRNGVGMDLCESAAAEVVESLLCSTGGGGAMKEWCGCAREKGEIGVMVVLEGSVGNIRIRREKESEEKE